LHASNLRHIDGIYGSRAAQNGRMMVYEGVTGDGRKGPGEGVADGDAASSSVPPLSTFARFDGPNGIPRHIPSCVVHYRVNRGVSSGIGRGLVAMFFGVANEKMSPPSNMTRAI